MPSPGKFEKVPGRAEKESVIEQQIAFASGLFQADVTIRTLLESLAEGVVVINKLGTILLVNARSEQMFGYARAEMIGKHHDMILPKRYREIHKKHMADFFSEPKIRPMGLGLDLIALHRDGKEFPVEISLSFINTSDNLFVLAFISDITLRKQVEQALKDRNQELDAFAHTLAHDIKNSVAVVTGFGKLLDQSIQDLSREEIMDSVKHIVSTGEKINHIINGLLRFATISREEVRFYPLDMSPLIASAIERLRSLIDERKAEIIQPGHFPRALGNDSWVEEIWFNYISNAVKYGGTPPKIELGATVRVDGSIDFWVKDNGPGIKPEQQTDIFDIYQSRKEKSQKGHGLGLSIVKRIAEKLNAQVGVGSVPEGGSIFSFSLPCAQQRRT